jgi:hypothetical protein
LDDFVKTLYEPKIKTTIDFSINGLDICTEFRACLPSKTGSQIKRPALLSKQISTPRYGYNYSVQAFEGNCNRMKDTFFQSIKVVKCSRSHTVVV